MQYVRSISGSVSKTWNSINPATLSGAIDVVVVEQEDGSLACSPFHIRFGKFSLLRPYEKKVEFSVNGETRDLPMKLGEGGEAFFVFETRDRVPEALQTSPLVSPATSPDLKGSPPVTPSLQEPDPFELDRSSTPHASDSPRRRPHSKSTTEYTSLQSHSNNAQSRIDRLSPLLPSPHIEALKRPMSEDFSAYPDHVLPKLERVPSDSVVPAARAALNDALQNGESLPVAFSDRSASPLRHEVDIQSTPIQVEQHEAKTRAMSLSKKLWTSNISNHVTESGDLMLDMTGFKSGNMEALQAEGIARQLLTEEIDGPYDIGALIGADEKGNIWIYSSEEAKAAAGKKAAEGLGSYNPTAYASTDALSDPGYHSDDAGSILKGEFRHGRHDSDSALGIPSAPSSPGAHTTAGDPNKNYAKTLRLTSDQLKTMNLQPGANAMAFTVNRATCNATLWYWKHDVPIVISDIDGTITKSDVLGQLLNTIGRDWTHQGVAKLYTEISSNGYNFLYLTSRSVGQADTTRAYLDGVVQEGFRLPKGPVILSPDRTIAALRREIYLRKPEIFKMACLRDIMALFAGHGGVDSNHAAEGAEHGLHVPTTPTDAPGGAGPGRGKAGSPFYAGFGNRLTDALSYRSVNIPSTRIFTINSNSEISLDLLSLNKYKTAYGTMREIVDYYFPPVSLLVKGGGEDFTDFNYWREQPLDIVDFTDSEDDEDEDDANVIAVAVKRVGTAERGSILSEDEAGDDMVESFLSEPRLSLEETLEESLREGEITEDDEDEYDDDGELDEDEEEGYEVEVSSGLRTPEPDPAKQNGSDSERERTPRRAERDIDAEVRLGLTLD